MPLISSLGALSTRGFGQFRITLPPLPPVEAGTLGMIMLSGGSPNTNKYTFADKTIVAGPALKEEIMQGAAAANSNLLVTMGQNSTTVQKYAWATDLTSTGPAAPALAPSLAGAASNASQGIFHNGRNQTITSLYDYGPDTLTVGANTLRRGRWMSAAGRSDVAVFHFGNTAIADKYSYADGSWTVGTNFTSFTICGAGCGVAEFAIFTVGETTQNSNRYSYSTDAVDVASMFTTNVGSGCAVGNDTSGLYVAGGVVSSGAAREVTSEYLWASNTTSVGTSITSASSFVSGSGNGTTGVNV